MVSNETLLALQAALFAATLVVLLRCRRSPEPPPPPLPLAVPLPDTEPVGQKRKGKTKRQAPFGGEIGNKGVARRSGNEQEQEEEQGKNQKQGMWIFATFFFLANYLTCSILITEAGNYVARSWGRQAELLFFQKDVGVIQIQFPRQSKTDVWSWLLKCIWFFGCFLMM